MSEREELIDRREDLLGEMEDYMTGIRGVLEDLISENEDDRQDAIEWIDSYLTDAIEAHNELKEIQEKLDQLDEDEETA